MDLAFENLAVRYGDLTALEGLDLAVASGESVAIIGPSGCGKSTLLRVAAGLLAPSAGEARIGGEPVAGPRRDVALILQDYGLLPWKTVFRNAELGLRVRKVPQREREARTWAALEQVGLAQFAKAYPRELSGGMQQRLALARAVALNAQVLLMDEPLSAIDALLREELQELLLQLWRNSKQTQVLVTHSIEEAVFLGQRIVVMAPRPGRVVAQVQNPGVGLPSYRSSDEFYERVREVREALDRAGAAGAAGVAGAAGLPGGQAVSGEAGARACADEGAGEGDCAGAGEGGHA